MPHKCRPCIAYSKTIIVVKAARMDFLFSCGPSIQTQYLTSQKKRRVPEFFSYFVYLARLSLSFVIPLTLGVLMNINKK